MLPDGGAEMDIQITPAKLSGAVLEMNLKALEFGANAKEDPQCK